MKQFNNIKRYFLSACALFSFMAVSAQDTNADKNFSAIEVEEFDRSYATSVEELIEGQVAGVRIANTDGAPMSALSTIIRGTNSFRGNTEPLWIIDGTMINPPSLETGTFLWADDDDYTVLQNTLASINPNDIVSIEILKDMQATALYGSRGANGVVLVTTSRGKTSRGDGLEVKFQTNVEVSMAKDNTTEMLSLSDYKAYQSQLGNTTASVLSGDLDIADDVLSNSVSTNTNFILSGGAAGQKYHISANYRSIDGVMDSSNGTVASARINYLNKVGNYMEYGTSILMSFANYHAPRTTTTFGDQSMGTLLTTGIPATDGYTGESYSSWASDYDDISTDYRVSQGFYLDFFITKNWTLNNNVSLEYRNKKRFMWMGNGTPLGLENDGVLSATTLETLQYVYNPNLVYDGSTNDHYYRGEVGAELFGSEQDYTTSVGYGFFNHSLRTSGLNWADIQDPLHIYFDRTFSTALYLSGSYAYKGKYGVDLLLRADNNTVIDHGDFTYYPSAKVYWDLKNESFAKDLNGLSALRISLGYGKAGSESVYHYDKVVDNIGYNAYYPVVDEDHSIFYKGVSRSISEEFNAKLNFGLLNNKIQAEVGVYSKETTDGLYVYRIGESSKRNSLDTDYIGSWDYIDAVKEFSNESVLVNRGVEVSLSATILETDDFSWNMSFTGALNDNEVIKVAEGDKYGQEIASGLVATANVVGASSNSFAGLTSLGVATAETINTAPTFYGEPAQLGDLIYADKTGDGNVDDDDLSIIGSPHPSFIGSFSTSVKYKNFSASISFEGVYGNEILNLNRLLEENVSSTTNISADAYNYAYPATINYPAIGANGTGVISDRYVEDGSYLRLSNITLGYEFNLKSEFVKSLNLSLALNDLYTLTDYTGNDPDVNSYATSISTYGIDYGSYASSSSVVLGVRLTF